MIVFSTSVTTQDLKRPYNIQLCTFQSVYFVQIQRIAKVTGQCHRTATGTDSVSGT